MKQSSLLKSFVIMVVLNNNLFLNGNMTYMDSSPKPIVLVTVSQKWNSIIEQNLQTCINNDMSLIWIHHQKYNGSESVPNFVEISRHLKILEVTSKANYVEAFLFKALEFINESNWCFLVASDELISDQLLKEIFYQLNNFNDKYVYAITRLWIKKINGYYSSSKIAVSSESDHDFQYRIFKTEHQSENTKIHSPGFVLKKTKLVITNNSLLHLAWEVENIWDRIEKIKRYDSISPNAGRGKLRYYLPEIFSDAEHDWQKLDSFDQQLLDSWQQINFRQNLTIQ